MPVYLVGGWYDSWAGNTTANFRALSEDAEERRLSHHGAVDSWRAGQVGARPGRFRQGRGDRRSNSRGGWSGSITGSKGIDNAVGKAAPFATKVRIFVMGTGDGGKTEKGLLRHGGAWRDEHEWPLARATAHAVLPRSPAAGSRQRNRRRDERSTSYDFDPRNPVPTLGGNISSGDGIMQQGAWDQRGGENFWNWPKPIPLSARNDVVVFQTEPLAEDIEVTGEIEVKLWASSSAVGHRLHRQAPRRLSAERRLARRLRPEPRRRHRARPLPRVAQGGKADGARRGLSLHDQALPDVERLQERPPHPRRHLAAATSRAST